MTMPFPSNDAGVLPLTPDNTNADTLPWQRLGPTEQTPLSFTVKLRSGEVHTFSYSDLRGTKLAHAGSLTIHVLGMEKIHIVIQGRLLGALAAQISLGRIRSFEESSLAAKDLPEDAPHIERITFDILTGPY